ncbi:hypothetical protein O6H91_07G014700 [Diphasiastrum complanatum]|uniref:Uncharacterized protein n=3 Tax=Diphasiastrum complanatum TaxID=34168 RepID=A0ACC2D323_DIPCM|nr:hypothetical protein O6H91_Y306300 [Diphasiastrum complanatum]KAJ7289026.1 hypothetical protein O6H91_Y306300 [Diphasiastrum complanatum]KAJ7289027.1 hypothetical protein O6H91_Y306300 [Diphasiastrum complanatum]KAJ7548510.1 hypothetical protein O6H91_07G014700 [Diphasiastrum complanatum]KAJ7548513.1 hypothetical protein O6H91_07G014700 [Diphasiastrum complanatum]
MEKSAGLAGSEHSFQHFWNINPKQEQVDDWRPTPVNETYTRSDSPREDLSWAITPVRKVEDVRDFEDQGIVHDNNSPQGLDDNAPCYIKEIGYGDQSVGSSLKNDRVYSPAPLAARAPTQNQIQNFASLQRPVGAARGGPPVAAFTVQCSDCLKWRMIPTKEKYEAIRQCILEQPWVCENARSWRPGASCEDPTDFSQDSGALWAIDRPNIPRPPPGWERKLVIRGEGSTRFGDIYYHSPCGKKLRSMVEVDKFLKEHPEYVENGVNLYQFSYTVPQPLNGGYVRPRKKDRETMNHSAAAKFLLHQTLAKQLGDSKCPGKSMRGSLKRVFGKLIAPNHVPITSQIAPASACQTFTDRMVPCANAQTAGGSLCYPNDLQIASQNARSELSKGERTVKSESFSRSISGTDQFSSHLQRGANDCANDFSKSPCQEVQACVSQIDAANSSQQIVYPFAGYSDPSSGVPQFLRKKRRTVRLSSIIDLESDVSNWRSNEQHDMLGSSTLPCTDVFIAERSNESQSLTADLSNFDLTEGATSFPGLSSEIRPLGSSL